MERKSKHTKMGLSRFGKSSIRRTRQTVIFLVEGKNTEPAYFDWLRKQGLVSEKFNLKLRHAEGATSAKNLLSRAKRIRKENPDAYLCVILDKDENSDEVLNSLQGWAKKFPEKCKVAITFPKFELFLLMHYGDVSGLNTAGAIDSQMEIYQPGYSRKKIPNLERLSADSVLAALKRAKLAKNQLPERDASQIADLVEWLIKSDEK